uniref:Uncharacterized protein n=1 Tax=Amphimedon queenslandica TaxID=400682 RepID=A0A1X7TC41_AMPQE
MFLQSHKIQVAVPNDPDCSPISSAVVPNGPSSPTTCASSTLKLLNSLCTRIDRLKSKNSVLISHITSIFSYLPPNIQQFHQQALFSPFNQLQHPFNPAVSIRQDFYSPVTQQQSLAPITQQQSLAPITQQQSLAAMTQQQSLAPITQQQSLDLVTQEQSLAPITQELHVLTIPSSIMPPLLPPSITSPPFSHSITHTPASTPPLSDGLLDPDEVIANYCKLQTISNTGRLAVRLASVSYFGKNLLKRSTVYGLKGNASLPGNKVDTPAEFEPLWTKYVNAINHHVSGLHKKDKVGVTLELN